VAYRVVGVCCGANVAASSNVAMPWRNIATLCRSINIHSSIVPYPVLYSPFWDLPDTQRCARLLYHHAHHFCTHSHATNLPTVSYAPSPIWACTSQPHSTSTTHTLTVPFPRSHSWPCLSLLLHTQPPHSLWRVGRSKLLQRARTTARTRLARNGRGDGRRAWRRKAKGVA